MSWHLSLAMIEELGSSHCSPEPGAASLEAACLDTESCAQLNTNRTALKSSVDGKKKGILKPSQYGTISEPSMVNRGVAKWIACLLDSPARPTPSPASEKAPMTSKICGRTRFASLEKSLPDSSSLRTSLGYLAQWIIPQMSLFRTSEPYSETWPKAAMIVDGIAYRRQPLVRPTKDQGSGLWRSPSSQQPGAKVESVETKDGGPAKIGERAYYKESGKLAQVGLEQQVKMWPTPQCADGAMGAVLNETTEIYWLKSGRPRKVSKQGVDGSVGLARAVALGGTQTPQTFPTPDARGFTNQGSMELLAKADIPTEEKRGMSFRAGKAKKDKNYPTPRGGGKTGDVGMCGGTGAYQQIQKLDVPENEKKAMAHGKGGALNPAWVAWLMNFPVGWTSLEPLSEDRFRGWLQGCGIELID